MFDIRKILEKSGIDVKKLEEEAGQVPALLKALVEQNNAQVKAIKEILSRVDIIDQKTDHIYNKLYEKKQ